MQWIVTHKLLRSAAIQARSPTTVKSFASLQQTGLYARPKSLFRSVMMSTAPDFYQIRFNEKADYKDDGAGTVTVSTGSASERDKTFLHQINNIPTEATWLKIEGDVPTDDEWEVLGSHFTSVQNLEVEAGFNESLNDKMVPAHWPLSRLLVSSSCGEVTLNPHILLGKVQHLIFMFTMGIRFEGPTSEELHTSHSQAVAAGAKDEHHVSDSGLTIVYRPRLVREWMSAKYSGKEIELEPDALCTNPNLNIDIEEVNAAIKEGPPALTKFEIIENDAIEAFIRFTMPLPHLSLNLRTLNIRSTNGCDLNDSPDDVFPTLLQSMDRLDTLVLTLGEIFEDEDTIAKIYQFLPPNIRTLRFRGPISLTQNAEWPNWVARFGDSTFLPKLECLSFVCDMWYDKMAENDWRRPKRYATAIELREAKEKCDQLYNSVRNRHPQEGGKQVVVEHFIEKWTHQVSHLDGVNPLWESV